MHQIDLYIETIARVIDWIAIAILFYGSLKAVAKFMALELGRLTKSATGSLGGLGKLGEDSRINLLDVNVRRSLGGYLLLGLELMIVSDIIHTAISRTLDDLIFLGGVVLIRTVVSYFLGKEIMHIEKTKITSNQK